MGKYFDANAQALGNCGMKSFYCEGKDKDITFETKVKEIFTYLDANAREFLLSIQRDMEKNQNRLLEKKYYELYLLNNEAFNEQHVFMMISHLMAKIRFSRYGSYELLTKDEFYKYFEATKTQSRKMVMEPYDTTGYFGVRIHSDPVKSRYDTYIESKKSIYDIEQDYIAAIIEKYFYFESYKRLYGNGDLHNCINQYNNLDISESFYDLALEYKKKYCIAN